MVRMSIISAYAENRPSLIQHLASLSRRHLTDIDWGCGLQVVGPPVTQSLSTHGPLHQLMHSLIQHNIKVATATCFDTTVPSSGGAKRQVSETVASVKLVLLSVAALLVVVIE